MANPAGLLTFNWDAPLTDTDRETLIDTVSSNVIRWKMQLPAMLLLEGIAPLGNIAAHVVIVGSPFAALFLQGGISDVQKIVRFLSDPKNVRALIDRIAEEELHAARQ